MKYLLEDIKTFYLQDTEMDVWLVATKKKNPR